jgi:hypothetical protein
LSAELALEILDELRVEPLGAAGAAGAAVPGRRAAATADLAAAAADARGRRHGGALELRDQLLDGPARRRVHDEKVEHHDPEQRRDHEQQAASDVGRHD